MQNQNWRFASKVIAVAVVTLLVVSFTTLAVAQRISGEERNSIFAAASRVSTSVKGVTVFAAPPKNFDPLTATNRELLSYGLPQRPDKTADAKGYEIWERAMLALKPAAAAGAGHTSANPMTATDVKALPYSSREMMGGNQTAGPKDDVSGVTFYTSGNWSGIAQTNKLQAWNKNTSFDEVVSVWPVPTANHAFGNLPCSEGPWWSVTWNGIDGFSNGDVVQGGSSQYWDGGGCGGAVQYYGWVEWYPSYSILAIYCGSSPCTVSPGDDFEVVTFGAAGIAEQFVFVEDITQQWSGTFGLTYITGPGVVGSSAEYIVERPCCNGSNLFPLGNYVYEFFDDSFAYDGKGTLFYPGNSGAATAIITMQADGAAGSQDISYPVFYGSSGNQGKYSIWLADENCAFSGGCAVGP
jgi:hypothetical protein